MTDEALTHMDQRAAREIERLDHATMAELWRHAPPGHRYFDAQGPYWPHFERRWKSFGGWNPKLSKEVGWDRHPN